MTVTDGLVYGHASSKRLKAKEKVNTRYLTHEQRSDTMRVPRAVSCTFETYIAQNVDSWLFVVRASNVGLLSNRLAQDAIPLSFFSDISSSLKVLIHKKLRHHQWIPQSSHHSLITQRKILTT